MQIITAAIQTAFRSVKSSVKMNLETANRLGREKKEWNVETRERTEAKVVRTLI